MRWVPNPFTASGGRLHIQNRRVIPVTTPDPERCACVRRALCNGRSVADPGPRGCGCGASRTSTGTSTGPVEAAQCRSLRSSKIESETAGQGPYAKPGRTRTAPLVRSSTPPSPTLRVLEDPRRQRATVSDAGGDRVTSLEGSASAHPPATDARTRYRARARRVTTSAASPQSWYRDWPRGIPELVLPARTTRRAVCRGSPSDPWANFLNVKTSSDR
jgi:hypothetical protein